MDWFAIAATIEMSRAEVVGWVAAIATAVATVVTAALTFWIRLIDTPRPSWEIATELDGWDIGNGPVMGGPFCVFSLGNVGTGSARLVSVVGVYCEADATSLHDRTGSANHIALAEVGARFRVTAWPMVSYWQRSGVLVTWAEPRRWAFGRRHRHVFFLISDYYQQPSPGRRETREDGRVVMSPVELDIGPREEIRQLDKRLAESGSVVLASSNRFARHGQFRELRRAGWQWRRVLSKVNRGARSQ